MKNCCVVAYVALTVATAALLCCLGVFGGTRARSTDGALPQTPFTYFKFTNRTPKKVSRLGYYRCNDGGCTEGEDRTPALSPSVTPEAPLPSGQSSTDVCNEPTTMAIRLSVQHEDDANGVNERVFAAPAGNTIRQFVVDCSSYDAAQDRYTVFVRLFLYDAAGNPLPAQSSTVTF